MEETKIEISPALRAAGALSECLTSLTSAAAKLSEKRATLEEKMIKRYFHDLAREISDASSLIHQRLSDGKLSWSSENHEAAMQLTTAIQDRLQEFHKAIDYDWNYLEQYFEHGFYLELTENSHLLEKIREFVSKLKS
ncbi:MAG: hypothetical protein DKT66_18815 [Candidatus Melainabacteria bacterium]|nr:MAG: hypothetical protein DKT66_18815 [Candidatus Melainabacteria bacterium]